MISIMEIRELRGLTLRTVAYKTGLDIQLLRAIERNEIRASVADMQKLANLYQVSISFVKDGVPCRPGDYLVLANAKCQKQITGLLPKNADGGLLAPGNTL